MWNGLPLPRVESPFATRYALAEDGREFYIGKDENNILIGTKPFKF